MGDIQNEKEIVSNYQEKVALLKRKKVLASSEYTIQVVSANDSLFP